MLAQGESLSLSAMLLGCGWIAMGLYSIGVWLESRGWALRLEWLRLALNLPALWLAGQFDLLAVDARAWLWLAGYSLISLLGLWLAQRGRAGAHGVGRPGTPAARSAANSPHVGV